MVKREAKRQYFDIAPQAAGSNASNIADPEDLPSNAPKEPETPSVVSSDTLIEPGENTEDSTPIIKHTAFTITPVNKTLVADKPQADAKEPTVKAERTTPPPETKAKHAKTAGKDIAATETSETDDIPGAPVIDAGKLALKEPVADKLKNSDELLGDEVDAASESKAETDSAEDNQPVPEAITTDSFEATDSLPDPGKKTADEAKANMQSPEIYDTKEFYLPIGHTHHKHGGVKGAFIFGIVCAIIVAGVAVYILYFLDK